MRPLRWLIGWVLALLLLLWRTTCRYSVVADPRPTLRAAQRPYVYALLHAHQIAAVFINDERKMAAMVSRSADGDLLVPSLRVRRVLAVRGSTRKAGKDKGGAAALTRLTELVGQRLPALLAVDGPRGPRNHVHRGVAQLAVDTEAAVLPTLVLPSRRWLLSRTWDRMQVPKPFSHVRLIFGPPLFAEAGDDVEHLQQRVAVALAALEHEHDAEEYLHAQVEGRPPAARPA